MVLKTSNWQYNMSYLKAKKPHLQAQLKKNKDVWLLNFNTFSFCMDAEHAHREDVCNSYEKDVEIQTQYQFSSWWSLWHMLTWGSAAVQHACYRYTSRWKSPDLRVFDSYFKRVQVVLNVKKFLQGVPKMWWPWTLTSVHSSLSRHLCRMKKFPQTLGSEESFRQPEDTVS